MPASLAKREQTDARRLAAWSLYCQGMNQQLIAERLNVTRRTIEADLATVRRHHPARDLDDADRFVEAHSVMAAAGQLLHSELAAAKARGDDTTRLLALVSSHADRMGRFLTRASAVPVIEASTGSGIDLAALDHILGRNHMESAALTPNRDNVTAAADALPPASW